MLLQLWSAGDTTNRRYNTLRPKLMPMIHAAESGTIIWFRPYQKSGAGFWCQIQI